MPRTLPCALLLCHSTLAEGESKVPNPSSFDLFQLKCEAPMMPSEELLILNLTGASLCVSPL